MGIRTYTLHLTVNLYTFSSHLKCNLCITNGGYHQNGRVELQRLNFKCEINVYRFTLRCNAAKKTKQDKTKPIKPNNPQISIPNIYIYILLTRISDVTFNPQLVLFDRLPLMVLCLFIRKDRTSYTRVTLKYRRCDYIAFWVRGIYSGILIDLYVAYLVKYKSMTYTYTPVSWSLCNKSSLNNQNTPLTNIIYIYIYIYIYI